MIPFIFLRSAIYLKKKYYEKHIDQKHLENSYESYINKNKHGRGVFDIVMEKMEDALDS